MSTSTASKQIPDLSSSFDAAADRVRDLNEKLIVTAKKSGTASLDAYEKGADDLRRLPAEGGRRQPARLGEHRRPGSDRLPHRGQRRLHLCSPRGPEVTSRRLAPWPSSRRRKITSPSGRSSVVSASSLSCRCGRWPRWPGSPARISPRSSADFVIRPRRCSTHSPIRCRFPPHCSGSRRPIPNRPEQTVQAIQADPDLTVSQRRSLTEAYTAMRQVTVARRRTRGRRTGRSQTQHVDQEDAR